MADGTGGEAAGSGQAAPGRRTWQWAGSLVLAAALVAVAVWLGVPGTTAPSVATTVSDCTSSAPAPPAGRAPTLGRPAIVGVGAYASIAVFHTTGQWRWCFDGMGTGGGTITAAAMRAPVGVPLVLVDVGTAYDHDALVLVHRSAATARVVIDAADSQSTVVASRGGFAVLDVHLDRALDWHAPWPRSPVVLGQVLGFDRRGVVTASRPFTVCPGSIDSLPGEGC